MKKFGIVTTALVFGFLLVYTGMAFGSSVTYTGLLRGTSGTLTYTHNALSVTAYAGEMKFTYGSGTTFTTFCVEFTENVYENYTYQYSLDDFATGGGYGGQSSTETGKDYLSNQTAWLYWSYLNGGITVSNATEAKDLQLAIWAFEDELVNNDLTGNQYYDLAIGAVAGGWSNNGRIKVMNLTYNGDDAQSVLVYTGEGGNVPIPGAVWLLGSGLIGLVGIRKRFKRR